MSDYRPIHLENHPKGARFDAVDDENIVFFGDEDNTLWLLDMNDNKLFIVNDKNTKFLDENGKDITHSVCAKILVDAIQQFQLEKEVLLVDTKRSKQNNAHPEMLQNLQDAANYALQYYHFTSDSAMWYNLL